MGVIILCSTSVDVNVLAAPTVLDVVNTELDGDTHESTDMLLGSGKALWQIVVSALWLEEWAWELLRWRDCYI